jgi:NADH-quinone oxidoreductase subunit L
LVTNRSNRLSHWLAILAMLISWGIALFVFYLAVSTEHLGEHPFTASFEWLPLGTNWIEFGFLIDPLAAVTLFFVVWTCLSIFIYSVGYHNFGKARGPEDRAGLPPHHGGVEPMYARFFAFISLFAFGMLTLVISDNLLLLFIGWEIMGLCSYLLIGFWFGRESARKAMVKAFMVTRIGDMFLLLGLVYLYAVTGTLNFQEILRDPDALQSLSELPSVIGPWIPAAGLIGLLIFGGTVGKSAQFPLHVWLPDAMEGPTPVSAMIHAATMVSAGVFLILRFFPLITAGWHHGDPLNGTMIVIAAIGTFTALFSSTIAVAQKDIKRVLAYSTISQLGYMVAAVGIGAFVAAAFHLVTHAFFKALLFLGSGSVIHGVEHGVHETHEHIDAQDMFNMGGLRRKMPLTFVTFLIGGLALSGFPIITAGFWSKDEILAEAYHNGHLIVFVVLAIAAFLTAFYTARQITLTFLGKARTEPAEHAHESVWTMTFPLIILAIFAVVFGWLGIPSTFPVIGGLLPNWVHEFIGETLLEHGAELEFNAIPVLISILIAISGLMFGWLVYRRVPAGAPDPLKRPLGKLYTLLENKYYFDEIYHQIFVKPAYWFAATVTLKWIDRGVIDGFLHWIAFASFRIGNFLRSRIDLPIINGVGDWVGESTKRVGREGRIIQSGRIQAYLIIGMLFTALMISYLLFFQ